MNPEEQSLKTALSLRKVMRDHSITIKIVGLLSISKPALHGNLFQADNLKKFLMEQLSKESTLSFKITPLVYLVIQNIAMETQKVNFRVQLDENLVYIEEAETLELIRNMYNGDIVLGNEPQKPQNYFDNDDCLTISSLPEDAADAQLRKEMEELKIENLRLKALNEKLQAQEEERKQEDRKVVEQEKEVVENARQIQEAKEAEEKQQESLRQKKISVQTVDPYEEYIRQQRLLLTTHDPVKALRERRRKEKGESYLNTYEWHLECQALFHATNR